MKIFLFHRVNPLNDPLWPAIHPRQFLKQISFLNKQFEIVNLESFLIKKQTFTSKKPLASIVFDDGYIDIRDYAIPILGRFDIKPSIYVVSNCIDEGQVIWTYLFDYVFQNTRKTNLLINLEGKSISYNWPNKKDKFTTAKNLKIVLKKTNIENRVRLLNEIVEQFSDVEYPKSPYLNWQDLRDLQNEGVIIGSHSANHELLDQIEDMNLLEYELKHSRNRIKEELGQFPETISYPNGNYNDTVQDFAKKVGYKFGLAVNQKKYDPSVDGLYEIPRIELFNEPLWKTKLRISGRIQSIKRIIGR